MEYCKVMKIILFYLFLIGSLFAKEHFAKVEPWETITIKAQASGVVTQATINKEGVVVDGVIVQLDDLLNKKDLRSTKESLKLIKEMIKLNSSMLAELKKNMHKKEELYKKVSPLTSSSISQKNTLYAAFVAAKSQYNAALEKILNLKNQKVNLEQKIATLKDIIAKKQISVTSKYLYKLNVKKGEFVNIGMPVATVMDTHKGKITLYLDADEVQAIDNKQIFINKKKSSAKIVKIWKVADVKYISLYRVDIEVPAPKTFSQLVKVEFE